MKQPYSMYPGDALDLAFLWSDYLDTAETIVTAVLTAGPNMVVNSTSPTPKAVAFNATLNSASAIGYETWVKCTITTDAIPLRRVTRLMRIVGSLITVESDVE